MPEVARMNLPALLDRDVSWLEFNKRVLHEAMDDRTPLLERVKFLAGNETGGTCVLRSPPL
jgi:polyphosphate kinase